MTNESAPLHISHISKTFAGKSAVNDVSFTVHPGEIIGFLGPNGAGKTTTLRMALGLVRPDEGEVKLFGHRPGPDAFGRIGFLPEERGLYKKQTARESIAHMARLNGIKKRDAFRIADDMLTRYGLGEAARKKNKDLSKGMAQKVQLLAAIAHDPEFLILDEPFSGLDPVNQQILEDIVREIASRGRTIIFSTHVMQHAERLCDRIILMSGGKVVFDGSTDEALSKAPRRLLISSENSALGETLAPFIKSKINQSDGTIDVIMKKNSDSHSILEECVERNIKLTRFEPRRATLHEAFVAMVGTDAIGDMEREG